MAILAATDKGHELMLAGFCKNATDVTQFLASLWNDTIVGTDDLSDLQNEMNSGTESGYARITIEASGTGWPTLALDSSEMQIQSKTVTFTATGAWTNPFTAVGILANMATDALFLYSNVPSTTLSNGDSFAVTVKFKLTK